MGKAQKMLEPKTQPAFEHDPSRSGMVNKIYSANPPEFTGVARSVECFHNQGHNNFRILTLYIEKGIVVKTEVSDPYAQWEALDKIEFWTRNALLNLNDRWENGRTLSK